MTYRAWLMTFWVFSMNACGAPVEQSFFEPASRESQTGKGGSGSSGSGGRSAQGGLSSGTGGNGGVIGSAAGTGGGPTSGSGGGPSNVAECDWSRETTDCSSQACSVCDTDEKSDACEKSCTAIIQCVKQNPDCSTADDPLCKLRNATSGAANKCTTVYESSWDAPQAQALKLRQCVCQR